MGLDYSYFIVVVEEFGIIYCGGIFMFIGGMGLDYSYFIVVVCNFVDKEINLYVDGWEKVGCFLIYDIFVSLSLHFLIFSRP